LETGLGGHGWRHRGDGTGAQRCHRDDGSGQLRGPSEGQYGCHAYLNFDIKKEYLKNNFCNWPPRYQKFIIDRVQLNSTVRTL
jgi:hypothetical protein